MREFTCFKDLPLPMDWREQRQREVMLWRAVLDQAVADMAYAGPASAGKREQRLAYLWFTNHLHGLHMEQGDVMESRAGQSLTPAQVEQVRRMAVQHSCKKQGCFEEVCDLAQVDPDWARARIVARHKDILIQLSQEYAHGT